MKKKLMKIYLKYIKNMLNELEILDSFFFFFFFFFDNTKIWILNIALQKDLKWTNVLKFKNNWKECCNYVKRIVPDIMFSHLKEKNIQKKKKN